MITNLSIQKIVTYSLESLELKPYKKEKEIDIIKIYEQHEITMIKRELELTIRLLKKELKTIQAIFQDKRAKFNPKPYKEINDPEFEQFWREMKKDITEGNLDGSTVDDY